MYRPAVCAAVASLVALLFIATVADAATGGKLLAAYPEWHDGSVVVAGGHDIEIVNALAFKLMLTTAEDLRLTVAWQMSRANCSRQDKAMGLCDRVFAFTEKTAGRRHAIPISRVYADTSYVYKIMAGWGHVIGKGCFHTGQLPAALAHYNNTVDSVSAGAHPDTLYFTSNSQPDLVFFALEAVTGRVVWYVEHNDGPLYEENFSRTGWKQVPVTDPADPDHFAYVLLDSPRMYKVSPLGALQESTSVIVPIPPVQYPLYPPSAFPNGCETLNHWMAVDGNMAYGIGDQVVFLDGQCYYDGVIWRWNMDTYQTELWIQLDELFPIDPALHYGPINVDWTNCGADRINVSINECVSRFHTNFVQASDWEDYFVINTNGAGYDGVVLLVDKVTRALRYVISPSDAISNFTFVNESDKFYGQHFVQLHGPDPANPFTAKPTLLVYDDGFGRPGFLDPALAFSRIALYELDFDALTIRLLFQYAPPGQPGSDYTHCFSAITGSVELVDNAYFVANFPCQNKPFPPNTPLYGTNVLVQVDTRGDVLTMMHSKAPPPPYSFGWTFFTTPVWSVVGERVYYDPHLF